MYSIFRYTFLRMRIIELYPLAIISLLLSPVYASEFESTNSDDYYFDNSLLRGNRFKIGDISQFNNAGNIEPGIHKVDLYINNVFSEQVDVSFVNSKSKKVLPCLAPTYLINLGVKPSSIKQSNINTEQKEQCVIPDEVISGATSRFTFSKLKLDISIPQALMNELPRGYVPPNKLNSGETMLFFNYMANQYHVSYKNSQTKNMDSTYVNFNGGFNIGLWRYRQQSFFNKQSGGHSDFTTSNRYVQRAITPLNSELLIGESYTTGQYFSGMGFRGISIKSDDRMLPESQRGYAPVVYGIARTNAKVTIRQNGNIIYQTTVPPGAFEIKDLYNTNYSGDLDVTVVEADGTTNNFTVPFSAVPESLRPGLSRYNLTLGKSRYVGDHDPFGEFTYRRGISNSITINTGTRIADGYQAGMFGAVYSSWLGAVGLDATFSNANLPGDNQSGWMMHLSYSRSFKPTNTTLSIANYHYSTSGYRDLNDVLGVRQAAKHNTYWDSTTYKQRSRLDLSINQSLGNLGTLYLSGSIQNYYANHESDKQLQLSYGKVFSNGVSMNLSVNRSRIGSSYYEDNMPSYHMPNYYTTFNKSRKETTTALSLSIPIGRSANAPTFSNNVNHSNMSGTSYQSSISGTLGESRNTNYSLNYSTDSRQHADTTSGNLQTRLPFATVGASISKAKDYLQNSATAQGAIVLHSGGVTLGPYLGDTFALVEAKGAEGAKVLGGQGSTIDWFGHALVPSLSPYRYNTIALNPEGMSSNIELQSNEYRLAPYAGANVKIKFRTIKGYPLLITTTRPIDADIIPMGATVYDSQNTQIGMVGQGGQAYVRTGQEKAQLIIRWGESSDQQCHLQYDLKGQDLEQPLIMLQSLCK